MKRNKAKLKLGRNRAARKFADMKTLKKRAQRQAYKTMFKKLSKGATNLAPGRKSEIEARLRKPIMVSKINRTAKKLVKVVRQREKDRKASKVAGK